ncbi:MAG: sugar nucleotide-binding protein, partial [Gammaproteobacteria bacterium]|nr:sugar nucleotide-binding protein [Gammaproteobacteria bacterium]
GLYHLSATGETTWCGFAREILESVKEEEGIRAKKVKAIATKEYPTPAKRPKRSTLDSSKLARNLGVTLPHWRDCLQQCLDTRTS